MVKRFLQFSGRAVCVAILPLQLANNPAGAAAGDGFGDGGGAWLLCLGSQLAALTQLRSCLLQPDNNPGQVCCLWLQGSALGAHSERELQELLTS